MSPSQNKGISARFLAIILGVAVSAMAGIAQADPPSRVARVGFVGGPVSFSPAGEDDWVDVGLNRPLVTGDRLWTDVGARVELQIGSAAVRLGETTSVTLLNLDDRVAQFQLAQGSLNVRVRRLAPDQVVEIDTPNLAFVVRRPGQYRVSVDPNGDLTQVSTTSGQAEVYGEGASYVVNAGTAYGFSGTGLGDYQILALPGPDDLDRWAQERDRGYDNSISARYVSRDVIGFQDLDTYGTWRAVPEYGNVWMPTRVSSGWSPYSEGHWAWVDPWGWTWVDDAPWGFAVTHYGRWANIGGAWGWIPGPVAAQAVYAPALVVFIGGNNFEVAIGSGNVGAVGWFPLGPRDVYTPAYPVSSAYFTNVNISNTVINNTTVNNVYINRNATNVAYANQQIAGAVVTVPTAAFVGSQPVARAAMHLPQSTMARAPVTNVAPFAPKQVSVNGAAAQGKKPPQQALERRVFAKSTPPAAPVGFAARERAMASNPGKPIDAAALATLKPATAVPAPKVQVVAAARDARPLAPPPQTGAMGKGEQKARPQATAPGAGPRAQTAPQMPGQAQPMQNGPAAPAQGTAQAPAEPRNKAEARNQPNAPAPVAGPQAVARPPQTNAPAVAQAPGEQRGKAEGRKQPNAATLDTAPPAKLAPQEQARARPESPAAAKPAPNAPATAVPIARAPNATQAGGAPASGPPPKREQRGNEPQPAGEKKGNEPARGDKKGNEPAKGDEDTKGK